MGSRPTHSRSRILLGIAAGVLLLAVVAYLGLSAYVADQLTRPKRLALTHTPADLGLTYERVQFTSTVDRIPLDGWYIDSPGSKVVLMLHGRDGIRDDPSLNLAGLMKDLAQNGYDIFTFDFRGHGQSGGEHYTFGVMEVRDVEGALAYLKARGVNEVGVMGFSMGAATALNAAPNHAEMHTIVADSPFARLQLITDPAVPAASGLPSFFNPGIYLMVNTLYGLDVGHDNPVERVAQLGDRPLFLIHGTRDPAIPVAHHEMLLAAGKNNPNLQQWMTTADHAQSYKEQPAEYLKRVLAFFQRYSWGEARASQ